jgi:cytochrome c biogenesis protein CcmG/thiol:disulfide interchange protein DsbE
MSRRTGSRHTTRWVAGAVLVALAVVGIVLATRTPQQATQVDSPLVGHLAPQFTGTDLRTGAHVSLHGWRGQFVVVNFFASWCIPCQEEAPDLVSFAYQQSHQASGAHLVSVVFHDSTSSARAFLVSQGATWAAINDPGGNIAQAYGVTAPPTTFVVDPSGRVTVDPCVGPASMRNLNALVRAARHHTSVACNA